MLKIFGNENSYFNPKTFLKEELQVLFKFVYFLYLKNILQDTYILYYSNHVKINRIIWFVYIDTFRPNFSSISAKNQSTTPLSKPTLEFSRDFLIVCLNSKQKFKMGLSDLFFEKMQPTISKKYFQIKIHFLVKY